MGDAPDHAGEMRLLASGARWQCAETADMLEAAADEIERLGAEVASLRLTLGGRTFSGQPVPDPVGCPAPGACAQVAEIGRLRAIVRVNALRWGATHEQIDEALNDTPPD
jgi:hypothetical protein